MRSQPLSDLERFEIVQAMFPDRLNEEDHDLGDEEEILWDEFSINPEDFDELVGRLVMLAPVMQSALQRKLYHTLGKTHIDGEKQFFIAAVKREMRQAEGGDH